MKTPYVYYKLEHRGNGQFRVYDPSAPKKTLHIAGNYELAKLWIAAYRKGEAWAQEKL